MSSTVSSLPRSGTVSSTRTKSSSIEGKKSVRKTDFVLKHGHRHHSFEPEKAPYPLSYDRDVLELEALDHRLVSYLRKGTTSFISFEPTQPLERILDLGCGTGTWVIDAAKEWPKCEFVGFDLVNIQIPLKLLNPSVAERITWIHGNFLTTKLPFEDDEFDHVHIQDVAKGVPENKWGVLFEEINRILRPGGSVEMIEDDIMFPSLPRWFTATLRARPQRTMSVHLPHGYPSSIDTQPQEMPSHDHALLESLYSSVFEHRFINMKPSAMLPSYFTTYFRHVTVCPVLNFAMPPFPPPQPLPQQQITTFAIEHGSDPLLSPASATSENRSPSLSVSSTLSANSTNLDSIFSSALPNSTQEKATPFPAAEEPEFVPSDPIVNGESPPRRSNSTASTSTMSSFKLYTVDSSSLDSADAAVPDTLFPAEQLATLNERSSAMHLYRAYRSVLACEEALWEEMKDRLRNRREELTPFGWDDDEELEELQSRKRFERLIERYKTDMETRVSLWCSLNELGWPFPPRDPLSKAEIIEEERIRDAMLDARRYAPPEELSTSCRSIRVLTGYKL